MLNNVLPVEAVHSSLDLFERQPLLVSFDTSFIQRIGPSYSPDAPNLEFEVIGNRNYFIDLQNIFLEIKWQIVQSDGTALVNAGAAGDRHHPSVVNNALHSLFSECNVFANGNKVSSTNGLYASKAFIETEFSTTKEAKDTWWVCSGYDYE